MKRDYKHQPKDTVNFFVGTEVEHTPAYGKRTLFVVGRKTPHEIENWYLEQDCEHIYLGANMSFTPEEDWDLTVLPLLKRGYLVTLDFTAENVEWILDSGYTEYRNFIAMISVKLPYIEQLGYNACLKLDDRDFAATNPGVWVHSVHDLMSRSQYTSWEEYKNDLPIQEFLVDNMQQDSVNSLLETETRDNG